jgi:glycerophosphoryl diester phosphodiesterase
MGKIVFINGFTPAAHRGASRQFPENTLEAFRRALEIVPSCILEIDVRMTADGNIVVFHDPFLDQNTDGRGPVRANTLAGIKGMDAGYGISFDGGLTHPFRGKGFRIAALGEALDAFPAAKMSIDIKDNDLDAASATLAVINERQAAGRIIIGSFHTRVVLFVRKNYPHIITSFSRRDAIRFYLLHKIGMSRFFKKGGAAMFLPECLLAGGPEYRGEKLYNGIRIISPRFIRSAHRLGFPVIVWTINRIENMRRLISWGADGIVTDRPDLLKGVMDERDIV